MSRKIALGMVVAGGVAACAFVVGVLVHEGLAAAGVWAGIVATLAGVVAAVAALLGPVPRLSRVLPPPDLEVPDWVVGRPAELSAVVTALVGGRASTVGITTGLFGAGGFGKTTLAQMVCADQRVRRRFGGRVYLMTVGRDVRGAAALAAKVNDVIRLVSGGEAAFADPQLAGARLGSLLDTGPRRLLVLDDVWEVEQLAPFTAGGKECARLVTTRVPELLAGRGTMVRVDQMSDEQARALLTAGLPPLDESVVAGLLAVTGRWPLLVRLVSQILADYLQAAADTRTVSAQGATLVERLAAGGPAVVDELASDRGRGLDVGQPSERARAVRATILASTGLLEGQDAERLTELGVFAEDEAIPFDLVARLWRAIAGLDELQASRVCKRLAQLALVSQARAPARGIALHDVIRDFLRAELGRQRLAELNGNLLDAVAASLPAASPLDARYPVRVAWWELADVDRYLWDHLIEHMVGAGRSSQADAIACDLRWVGARLELFGPAAPAADLATAGTPRAARLRDVLVRTAHLLAPTEPIGAVVDVLYSRVAADPDWGSQVTALAGSGRGPRLVNRWPLPDLPDPALRRVLKGHTSDALTVAVAPDGRWLASAGVDNTIRIWDADTGRERRVLRGHKDPVEAVAVAPDGRWLASASWDGTVRIWDVDSGRQRAVLKAKANREWVMAVAVAPDGRWLVSAGIDGTVRIWDPVSGRKRAALIGNLRGAVAVAVAPDGRWLASAGSDGTIRIFDAESGRERTVMKGHTGKVGAVAVAPDGRWLASAGSDGTIRIWDADSGQERAVMRGHTSDVNAVAVAPDGRWLASASRDGTVRIWDAGNGQTRAVLKSHDSTSVEAVAVAPDGRWLASASRDGTVRIWDADSGQEQTVMKGHTGKVGAVAVAPDGRWLASASLDGRMRIWDADSGREHDATAKQGVGSGHLDTSAVAVAPDGRWLASANGNRTVRIWDADSLRIRTVLKGHTDEVVAVAVAPDGRWLASCGWDGTVRIWDVDSGQQRAVLRAKREWVRVALKANSQWVQAVLKAHWEWVTAVAVAPDGRWLASGDDYGTVRIWDADSGQVQAVLKGHTGWAVVAVAVAPDGRWLASASRDGTVQIWDALNGRVCALMRVDASVSSCAWLRSDALTIGGSAGLYLFSFVDGTSPAAAGQ